jgi:hypothetical protein
MHFVIGLQGFFEAPIYIWRPGLGHVYVLLALGWATFVPLCLRFQSFSWPLRVEQA